MHSQIYLFSFSKVKKRLTLLHSAEISAKIVVEIKILLYSEKNMDYNYNSYTQNGEPDYYEIYTRQQKKTARGVFSRFHLAIFLYLIISFLISLIVEIALILAFGTEGAIKFLSEHEYIAQLLSFLPAYIVSFPIFFIIVKKMKTMPVAKSKLRLSEFFSLFLIAELAMQVGGVIGNLFSEFFASIKGNAVPNYTSELISSMPIWLTIAIGVIIGPIIEELMFRKLMIDRLSRYGNKVAIIVSSVSFGLFHGNFYQFFYASLIGLVLGFIYTKTRNVLYTIAMHILVNFFGSVAVIPVIEKTDELYEMIESIEAGIEVNFSEFFANLMIIGSYSMIQYAMIVGGAIMLFKFIKRKKYKIRDVWEYKLPREEAAGIIIANPGTITFLVASALFFAYSIII